MEKTDWLNTETNGFALDCTRIEAEEVTSARYSRDVIPFSKFNSWQRDDYYLATAIVDTSCLVCGKPLGKLPKCEANRAYCGCEG